MSVTHAAYELLKSTFIDEINSDAYILRHKKSGARIMLISNDDNNKVFSIGFRTPPEDNTGLPHILEHSVLCGSDKYPVKEVFVELCKGSLNTFLNAMTYPDKTVYPVASCNDKDFQNLMDVYLSSVLHPSIYDHPEIFMQEGWHYELESAEAPMTINGVVYNEMKGAFSSADEVMSRCIKQAMFPDNAYAQVQFFGVKYAIDRGSVQNHLCQTCLDSINNLWFTDQPPAEFAIVSFEDRTIQALLNSHPWFSAGNYGIDCEFKSDGAIDLLIHYCPRRYK